MEQFNHFHKQASHSKDGEKRQFCKQVERPN